MPGPQDRPLTPDELQRLSGAPTTPVATHDRPLTAGELIGQSGGRQMTNHPEARLSAPSFGERVRSALPAIGGTIGFAAGTPLGPEAVPLTTFIGGYAGQGAANTWRNVNALLGGPPVPSTFQQIQSMNTAGTEQAAGAAAGELAGQLPGAVTKLAGRAVGANKIAQPANAEVRAINDQYNLGLSGPELASTRGAPSWSRNIQALTERTVTGQKVAQTARTTGDQNAARAIGDQLDRLAGESSPNMVGRDVQNVLGASDQAAAAAHRTDQQLSRAAHDTLQDQAEVAYLRGASGRKAAHAAEQNRLLGKHQEAQTLFAADDQAQKQAALDAAYQARQAAGARMGELEKQAATDNLLVDTRAAKARAQQILDTELTPQSQSFPKKAATGSPAGDASWLDQISEDALGRMSPEARATILMAKQGSVDPFEAAKAITREHLQRVLNAPDAVPFADAAQQRAAMLEASKYFKIGKTKAEGQVRTVADALSSEMGRVHPNWKAASADYAAKIEAQDAALAESQKAFPKQAFKATPFKDEPFARVPYQATKYQPNASVAALLRRDPQEVIPALNSPARVVVARDTLLGMAKTAADPTERAQAAAAWDSLRTNWVRESLLKTHGQVDMASFPQRLRETDPDVLTAFFPDQPEVVKTLKDIGKALDRRDKLPEIRYAAAWEMVAMAGTAASGHPGAALSIPAAREAIPGVITWAMYKPELREALVEGFRSPNAEKGTRLLAQVIGAYRAERETNRPVTSRGTVGPPAPSTTSAGTRTVQGPPPPRSIQP